jgi:hypothetical protein
MNELTKEFIPYGLALRLKGVRFDEPCSAVYFGNGENELFTFNPSIAKETTIRMVELGHIACPTFSQAFRWFREKYNLHSVFEHDSDNYCYVIQGLMILILPLLMLVKRVRYIKPTKKQNLPALKS